MPTAKKKDLVTLLQRIQRERYHEPNSDHHEYCNGCGRSPYNVPPHGPECLVVVIRDVLRGS